MKHVTRPIFSYFLNTIHIRQPTQIEINNVISYFYISKIDILSHMDCNIMILCSHNKDVDKYNHVLIHKFFQLREIFTVTLDTNATSVENI